jgi:hypothetical protein
MHYILSGYSYQTIEGVENILILHINEKMDLSNTGPERFYGVKTYQDGTKIYFKNGKWNRDGDLPAIEYGTGDKLYYKNGLRHRDNDLPAVEYANGNKYYFRYGKEYFPNKESKNV